MSLGDFNVTLSIFNSQGDASSSQPITIDSNDISLFDNPLHLMLTGGISGPGYRTWHLDSACDYHFGVGPPNGSTPDYWHATANSKSGVGLYDDRFTFHLVGFQYDLVTNWDIYVHNTLGPNFAGAFENLYDWTAPFDDMLNENWDLTTDSVLTLSNAAPMGFYSGVSEFQITQLNDTSLWYKRHFFFLFLLRHFKLIQLYLNYFHGIFYMWNGNVLKEFNGINENAFDPKLLLKSLDYK